METKTDNSKAIPGINYHVYKEMIDFVYELTKDKEYTDGFSVYKNKILCLVVSEMVRRGVLQKKHLAYHAGKKGRYYAFTWAAKMAPTQTFIRSVANTIIEREREYKNKYQKRIRAEKKQQKLAEAQAPDIPILDVEIPDNVKPGVSLMKFEAPESGYYFAIVVNEEERKRVFWFDPHDGHVEKFGIESKIDDKVEMKEVDTNDDYAFDYLFNDLEELRRLQNQRPKSSLVQIKQQKEPSCLKDATPQQLWDELKSRGAKVVDGKIIIELD